VVNQGANAPEEHTVELAKNTGVVTLRLNTFTVPDEFRVTYQGQQIFNTGC